LENLKIKMLAMNAISLGENVSVAADARKSNVSVLFLIIKKVLSQYTLQKVNGFVRQFLANLTVNKALRELNTRSFLMNAILNILMEIKCVEVGNGSTLADILHFSSRCALRDWTSFHAICQRILIVDAK
jgi:hypothetical protein